ncbi:MAG: Smr/MutS family protein [Deltaproteobacteria bacterium]|nr:Smr/MutS family protein [Deltaproteobacteria bacterium]
MSKKNKPFNNPFGAVKLPEPPKPKPAPAPAIAKPPPAAGPRDLTLSDDELWSMAIDGAEVLRDRSEIVKPKARPIAQQQPVDPELAAYDELRELVDEVVPFRITGHVERAGAGELLEGAAQGLDANILKKLKRGAYAIEARLDLHGLIAAEARLALERFIAQSRHEGRRCVLVVHGRGLHSEGGVPVLKETVRRWVESDRLGRTILAFASAQPKDGGAGALVLLLKR